MGLDNVAVLWPREGQFYEPVPTEEFADFALIAENAPPHAGPAAALAKNIARTGTVRATAYVDLVDLMLGIDGVLSAVDKQAPDEIPGEDDPVISPDECAWIAGGLEKFIAAHEPHGDTVTFESAAEVLTTALSSARLADKELRWLKSRLDYLKDEHGNPPQWSFSLLELQVLARFYRRCTDKGWAVYAES